MDLLFIAEVVITFFLVAFFFVVLDLEVFVGETDFLCLVETFTFGFFEVLFGLVVLDLVVGGFVVRVSTVLVGFVVVVLLLVGAFVGVVLVIGFLDV